MEKKNSFVLYTDYRRQFDLLTDAELGQLIRAVMDYVETGQPPDLPAGPQMAFAFISAQIDRDMKKYQEVVEKRRAAGSAGGKQKASNAKQNMASVANANTCKQTLHDNDHVNENDIKKKDTKVSKEKSFIPPSVENVREYCQEGGYRVDAECFVNFYESKGWMVGKNRMKDWKAAVRKWARNDQKPSPKTGNRAIDKYNQFMHSDYDYDSLERDLLANK
ncbi:DUF6291 domain-containing protein [Eisenbergiella porci]|uniref:DUF6291 domain-containing protein n=1 Tax=Eisenbergiella porci TaxID=2652274 RepID=UPI002A81A8DC|nr:DUF6291 domain-containing protein [Eisenbergiella porci]